MFEKVSFEQWKKDAKEIGYIANDVDDEGLRYAYDRIILPKRSTSGSAGYDFFNPFPFGINVNHVIGKVATGIRWVPSRQDVALLLYARSSLASKYNFKPINCVGVVDSDYCNADNQGHIMLVYENDPYFGMHLIEAGEKIFQGIITPCIFEEEVSEQRTGGFGSTGK